MEKIVAFCGITCTECPAFIATQQDDDAKRRQVAEEWSEVYNNEIRPEQINCNGCLPGLGVHQQLHFCEVRKCGIEKAFQNCAYCVDYKCEKLRGLLEQIPQAKKTLEEIRQHLQERTKA